MEVISDRVSVVRKEGGTSIVISSVADRKKSRLVGALLLMWIIGGGIMFWSFPSITEDRTRIVVIIWAAFWIYFLYVMARLFRWKKYGHEVIKIKDDVLKYKKDVKGRGWVYDFSLAKMEKLRISETENPNWVRNLGGDFWNTDCDSLRFNYEDREISFGYQLSKEERQKLLNVLGDFVEREQKQSRRSQKEADWKKSAEE